jgi:thymidylate synthase (FAD)
VNKQGRSEDSVDPEIAKQWLETLGSDQRSIYTHYEEMIEGGLARELARINLPLSLYTEWYWQIDLHNLFHFIHLRADAHAQYEIRAYAEALATCARAVAPLAYEAFEEHKMHAIKFSRSECAALAKLLAGEEPELEERPMKIFSDKIDRLKKLS